MFFFSTGWVSPSFRDMLTLLELVPPICSPSPLTYSVTLGDTVGHWVGKVIETKIIEENFTVNISQVNIFQLYFPYNPVHYFLLLSANYIVKHFEILRSFYKAYYPCCHPPRSQCCTCFSTNRTFWPFLKGKFALKL